MVKRLIAIPRYPFAFWLQRIKPYFAGFPSRWFRYIFAFAIHGFMLEGEPA